MKALTGIFVLIAGLLLLEHGFALQCFTCEGDTCNKTKDCTTEDSCLALKAGDKKIKTCIKYSECDMMALSSKFPGISKFDFSCCQTSLCNAAAMPAAGPSVVAALLCVALFSLLFF